MQWMCAFIVKAEAVDGINAEKLYLPAIDKIGQRANHALAFQFRFIAGACRKSENRLSPVAVDENSQLKTQPRRMPTMIFTFHFLPPARPAGRESMPAHTGREQRN